VAEAAVEVLLQVLEQFFQALLAALAVEAEAEALDLAHVLEVVVQEIVLL
tara:strand:- start:215 stop:364 length:150 start_codon:yes stop_codon:yes gene_type:complete